MGNILISSAGRRVALLNIFKEEVKNLKLPSKVFTCDADPTWSPAGSLSDQAFKVSRCTDISFFDEIHRLCQEFDIKLIIPTIDTELSVYSHYANKFRDIGVDIMVSNEHCISIFRDKYKTACVLEKAGVSVPKTFLLNSELKEKNLRFPLIAKPINGSLSQGISVVYNIAELDSLANDVKKYNKKYVLQEFISGTEYTINCFINRKGKLLSAIPHKRVKVREGEVCFAITEKHSSLQQAAEKLVVNLPGIYGHICFQAMIDENNRAFIFEINGRFGGGYPLADKAGGKSAKWILQEVNDLPLDECEDWKEGLKMLRYDDAVFV